MNAFTSCIKIEFLTNIALKNIFKSNKKINVFSSKRKKRKKKKSTKFITSSLLYFDHIFQEGKS